MRQPVDGWFVPRDAQHVGLVGSAGERLLDDICDAIARYCILPGDHEYIAVTLWCAYTHLADVFDYAPRVVVRSPVKRSGKTRLLEVISDLVRKPLSLVNTTPSVIFHSIDEDSNQTLILDEVDAWFNNTSGDSGNNLRGLVNAGFQRGATVSRMGGKNMSKVIKFNVFAPVVLSGIGRMPDTIEDRSVLVMMRRRATHEKVDAYRLGRDQRGLYKLRDRIDKWAKEVRDVAKMYAVNGIDVPVDDRQADVWEPLLVIAQLAAGNWPDVAREACKGLCSKADVEESTYSTGQLLLSDIRDTFGSDDFIRSSDLVAFLKNQFHDSPWMDDMLTTSKLARKLHAYGICPRHSTDKGCRGYWRADFRDAWSRYLPDTPSEPSNCPDVGPDQAIWQDTRAMPETSHAAADTLPDDSENGTVSSETRSSEGVTGHVDASDASTPPTPRTVADANEAKRRAKGKEICESGKYAPKQQIDLGEWG